MRRTIFITACLLAIVLGGCASAPKMAPLLSMPAIPPDQVDMIDVELSFHQNIDIYESVVQNISRNIEVGSSIVINVPSMLFEEKSKESAENQDFKTKDFFNLAEQQIEKELIRKGFRVLSRSKFEAKLRSLRDEARCNPYEYRCLYSKVSPEIQPILEELKNKYDREEITSLQYSNEIKTFRDQMQISSAGKTRAEGEKELTDISEVIRAAESGKVSADYILQINLFDTEKKLRITKDLRHEKEIRNFVRSHPEIKNEFDSGNSKIACAVVGAELNAKLIYVQTGEIAWIGEHQLNEFSSGVQNLSVEMGSRRYVSNRENITEFVSQQNSPLGRQYRYGKSITVPDIEYRSSLIKPTLSSGRCEKTWNFSIDMRSELARQVAKELIATINVT
jgi:PBP1b-binding outer membrane lipoprotein LpoB